MRCSITPGLDSLLNLIKHGWNQSFVVGQVINSRLSFQIWTLWMWLLESNVVDRKNITFIVWFSCYRLKLCSNVLPVEKSLGRCMLDFGGRKTDPGYTSSIYDHLTACKQVQLILVWASEAWCLCKAVLSELHNFSFLFRKL